MPNAMTTVGQGSAAYVSVGGTAITNASTQNWRIGGKHKVPTLAVNSQIAGQSSSTQHVVRVYTDGSVGFRTTATDRVRTAAGVVSAGVDFTWSLENKVGVGMTLTVNGAEIGTFGTNSNFPINQLHRFSTTAASEATTSEFFHELAGVMQSQWNATNAPGTGTVWTSSGAVSRTLTITAHTGVADSWWVFYSNFYIGEATISVSASAQATLASSKVGNASVSAVAAAVSAAQGSKVGSAVLSMPITAGILLSASKNTSASITVPINAVLGIAANKVGVAPLYVEAIADISLYAGNIVAGAGTFSVTAAALVSVQGEKVGQSQVHFAAAAALFCTAAKLSGSDVSVSANATAQLQASKIGQSTTHLAASASASIDGYKVGLGTVAVLASATISLSGSNPAAVPAPVTVAFVRSSSRHTHSVRTSCRYSYNLKTSSGGARV